MRPYEQQLKFTSCAISCSQGLIFSLNKKTAINRKKRLDFSGSFKRGYGQASFFRVDRESLFNLNRGNLVPFLPTPVSKEKYLKTSESQNFVATCPRMCVL